MWNDLEQCLEYNKYVNPLGWDNKPPSPPCPSPAPLMKTAFYAVQCTPHYNVEQAMVPLEHVIMMVQSASDLLQSKQFYAYLELFFF